MNTKLTYKNFEHSTKILDPFYRDPGYIYTKYISSFVLKASKFSFVLSTHEYSDVFNTLDEIYSVFTTKSIYPLCLAPNDTFTAEKVLDTISEPGKYRQI